MDLEAKQAFAKRFKSCDPKVQDMAEAAGYRNLEERIQSGESIKAQASGTLQVLMAALAGAVAVGTRVLEPAPASPLAWGAAGLSVYLALLCLLLVGCCLRLVEAPMLFNSPGHLAMPGVSHADLRAGELANVVERIAQQSVLNTRRARWLNGVRFAAVLSPLVFLAAAAVAARLAA
ncbi:MAG TPA: hypothetical protein PLB26_17335 [Rubrivivax sp.]|nr:hypothetical protein [Rubrivivax sp.]